ncbi:OmpP1/FadL family transporter [Shimia ponticola]|uniref:OmpP1/FadL family transporter n=1 Tax=Shimia ponticola TaxID=2582893 RepID=UPI0011BFD443|nr:outer membrane protein transport protein [Shimia ponticola]
MKKLLMSSAAIALTTTAATAGGLDRSQQSTTFLFGDPGTGAVTIARVNPKITGTDDTGSGDYDIGQSFTQMGAYALVDGPSDITFGFQYDQAFGGDVLYGGDPTTAALAGTKADFAGESLNFMAKYQMNERVSVFGGIRAQKSGGEIALGGLAYTRAGVSGSDAYLAGARAGVSAALTGGPLDALAGVVSTGLSDEVIQAASLGTAGATDDLAAELTGLGVPVAFAGATAAGIVGALQPAFNAAVNTTAAAGFYDLEIEDDWGFGYTLGAAYEIPDIALRLAVTYHSEVDHTANASEQLAGTTREDKIDFTTPQSFNVDFQTGIAADTLLTFNYRWAEWGSFDVIPSLLGTDLADLDDSQRYSIGIARRINDALALSAGITYEAASNDDNVSPLSPTDGETGLNLGVRYEADGLTFSGGVGYTWIGDADAGVGGQDVASFEDNSVTTVGFRLTYEF